MPYEPKPYPKMLYHKTEPARIVKDAEAHDALRGDGWHESQDAANQATLFDSPADTAAADNEDALDPKPKRRR